MTTTTISITGDGTSVYFDTYAEGNSVTVPAGYAGTLNKTRVHLTKANGSPLTKGETVDVTVSIRKTPVASTGVTQEQIDSLASDQELASTAADIVEQASSQIVESISTAGDIKFVTRSSASRAGWQVLNGSLLKTPLTFNGAGVMLGGAALNTGLPASQGGFIGDSIYKITPTALNGTGVYNLTTRTESLYPGYPASHSAYARAASETKNALYTVCGFNGTSVTGACYKLNLTTGLWSSEAALVVGTTSDVGFSNLSAVVGNRLVSIGGQRSAGASANTLCKGVSVLNLNTGARTYLSLFPIFIGNAGVGSGVFVVDDHTLLVMTVPGQVAWSPDGSTLGSTAKCYKVVFNEQFTDYVATDLSASYSAAIPAGLPNLPAMYRTQEGMRMIVTVNTEVLFNESTDSFSLVTGTTKSLFSSDTFSQVGYGATVPVLNQGGNLLVPVAVNPYTSTRGILLVPCSATAVYAPMSSEDLCAIVKIS